MGGTSSILQDEIRTQLYPDALVPSFRERQIPIHRLIAPSAEEVLQISEEFYAGNREGRRNARSCIYGGCYLSSSRRYGWVISPLVDSGFRIMR